MKTNSSGKGVGFNRIRRVTGYLTGDVKFMNNSKRAEVTERVKHMGSSYMETKVGA